MCLLIFQANNFNFIDCNRSKLEYILSCFCYC